MTTTPIPDAAVRAVAEKLLEQYDSDMNGSHMEWQEFERPAREILAAALPLLGDTRTEWGLRIIHGDVEGINTQPDEATARDLATLMSDPVSEYQWTVVSRTVITGPWTETTR